ncbi:MAG: alkaline phosphatase family protein [Acidobacteriota bacterium]
MSPWRRWDDMALSLQCWIDRFTRKLRGVDPTLPSQRRFVIIQIDGLAHRHLELALKQGRMPFVRRLLQRGVVKETPFFCSLPTSTAAFQAGLFYGRIPNIPAWRYYDKRLQRQIHFPDPGDAALVESLEAEDATGLLKGGTCYGAVFSGDAETSVASFSRLYVPKLGFNWETVWFFIPNVIVFWVLFKIAVLMIYELAYELINSFLELIRYRQEWPSPRKILYHLFFHVIWRQLLTMGVSTDIYRGIPRIFVNYLSYDVFAHKYGPSSRIAMRSLKAIDASIRQIYRAVRRVPEYNYDVYILSDHGMAEAISFDQVSNTSLANLILGTLATSRLEKECQQPITAEMLKANGFADQLHGLIRIREATAMLPLPLAKLCEKYLVKYKNKYVELLSIQINLPKLLDEVKFVPAGPNILVYFTHKVDRVKVEEIEAYFPGLIARLSRQPGIGIILAQDAEGAVYYWRGQQFRADANKIVVGCPFHNLTYRPLLMRAISELMNMPSAGDLIIYGNYGNGSGQGTISYLGERGSHAGLSTDELFAFIIYPRKVEFAFERVTRPNELYQFFSQYLTPVQQVVEDLRSRQRA